jgi:hypothetical protein
MESKSENFAAEYLQVPYQEDIVLFRSKSKASRIEDEKFRGNDDQWTERIKLRPGRSSKTCDN